MTRQANILQAKIFKLKEKEECFINQGMDNKARIIMEERLGMEKEICPGCSGEGEVVRSYMPNNPYLIDVPYVLCETCRGTGIL